MYQHFDVSVPHRCDFATTNSSIGDAAMLAVASIHSTTMIQAVAAHCGAHTEKIVRIHLGLTGAEHITHEELPQPCSLRPIDLCELSGQSHDHQHWSCDWPGRGLIRSTAGARQLRPMRALSKASKNEQFVYILYQLLPFCGLYAKPCRMGAL